LSAPNTRTVNIREIGWPKGPGDVYIGRPSQWENPFIIGKDGDRDQVIDKFDRYLQTRDDLIQLLPQLAGKKLYCYCAPMRCHGDSLIAELKKRHPKLILA
jgi:hypothetical protein